jgi:integrase
MALEARALLLKGVDPGKVKAAAKRTGDTAQRFEEVALEWFARFCPSWSERHAHMIKLRMDKYVIPALGRLAIGDTRAPEILAMLRKIEAAGTIETAHRVKVIVGQICRYAVATGRTDRDPTGDLRGALPSPKRQHFGAALDPEDVGKLLRATDAYHGTPTVKAALAMAPLVFVRPGELRSARWAEIDLNSKTWIIPAARMKGQKQDHVVPLSRQAVEILRNLQSLGQSGDYVFPGYRTRTRPMSDATITAVLRAIGYPAGSVTLHGWRATARTLLDEVLHFRPEIIEHQLAHTVKDPLGRAYNRTQHLEERRRMMQVWSDYLDELRGTGGDRQVVV